jgi:hypothetical protein
MPSFWNLKNKNPDSIAGKALLLAGGTYVVVFHGLDILGWLDRMVWDSIHIAVGVGVIGAGWLLLRDGRLIKLVDYAFQALVRTAVGQFVAVFPIDIMKSRLAEIDKRLESITSWIQKLRGAKENAQQTLNSYIAERDEHDGLIKQAMEHPEEDEERQRLFLAKHSAQAQRREEQIPTFEALIDRMDTTVKILVKAKMKAEFFRDDMHDRITFTEQNRKALQAAVGAVRSIQRILKGGDLGDEFYQMAVEAANQQAADYVGELDQFMDDAKDTMRAFDLQNYDAVDKALKRLEARGDAKILGYQQGDLKLQLEHKPGETINVPMPSGHETVDDISKLLDRR